MAKSQTWMVVYEKKEVEDMLTTLCAQGYPDDYVADRVRETGEVEKITAEDVKKFRQHSAKSITQMADRAAKDLMSRIPRTKKSYRIGEMDKLVTLIAEAIPQYLIMDKPLWAARLMATYLQAMKQLAEEAGDFSSAETENRWITLMQHADMQQKKELTSKLLELEELSRKIQSGESVSVPVVKVVEEEPARDTETIEAEFFVEDDVDK